LHNKKWQEVRNQVTKYGFAAIELLVQAAQQRENLESLGDKDLLSEQEIVILGKLLIWQRPMILWAWIMRICVSAMDHHKSPPPRTQAVVAQCIAARQGMATINTYQDTQLPFAYVHLVALLVNIQNLVIACESGIVFATAIPGGQVWVMVQQVISCIVVGFIYQSLLQISYVILDPFGDDILDFPMEIYTSYLAMTVDAMFEAQENCPVVGDDGSLHPPRRNGGNSYADPHADPPYA